jgi:exodeoxyribonuclease VII large subunit
MALQNRTMTVSQLNLLLREHLETEPLLMNIGVTGEISNWREVPALGQIYFTVSDGQSSLGCVLFQTTMSRLSFVPKDKQQVALKGKIRFFQKRGTVHFQVHHMMPAGAGLQSVQLEALKAKLREEGLFDVARKQAMPRLPTHVAVVTSPESAGFADFVRVFASGFPWAKLSVFPSLVQGRSAPETMMAALDLAEASPASVIVLLRGGGSQEDLSCFNHEGLLRRVAALTKPVVTAIGHETDMPLVDFVSDMRASTPTAAAQLLVTQLVQTLQSVLADVVEAGQTLDEEITQMAHHVTRQMDRIQLQIMHRVAAATQKTEMLVSAIQMADPMVRLRRGYSVVTSSKTGAVIRDVGQVTVSDPLTVHVANGVLHVCVTDIKQGL